MISIQRLPEPQILIERKEIWKGNFIASGKKRPDSNKYGHNSIRQQLMSMSFTKCFYCESKLKGKRKEIDHHIEVSIDKTLSFEWANLYLACDNCNGKIPHTTIPIQDTLDPCRDSEENIEDNLTFNDEFIQPKNNSELGLRTIKKYRLDTELLDNRRLKQLKIFFKVLLEIKDQQRLEKRDALNQDELTALNSFKRVDNSFSRMFAVILENYNI
jgi:5-methylcytosine-specific restriction endonuclease McrA